MSALYLYNTLSKQKELFTPLKQGVVSMYVCGPTVYDHPHIGNARSVVVYDVLYRLFSNIYGLENITYVRNITDVDDKINQAAKTRQVAIGQITEQCTQIFHSAMSYINCLPPTIEPKATEHIEEMIFIIEKLLASGHAYISQNHVYFKVSHCPNYASLAGRVLEDLVPGARIKIADAKADPEDFVLWKPAEPDDEVSSVFDSPWGKGRPGWHIECSAMSYKYLGTDFDIHGGGMDLVFPHHSNEIAQSCCAFPGSSYAKLWVHNGFVTVSGEKMSKSLGNFITVTDLKAQAIKGEVIRYCLISTHYRKPLDWNQHGVDQAVKALGSFYQALKHIDANLVQTEEIAEDAIAALLDDLNTHLLLTYLHSIVKEINKADDQLMRHNLAVQLKLAGNLVGLLEQSPAEWFAVDIDEAWVQSKIAERNQAKLEKNWQLADSIRAELKSQQIILEDRADGSTGYKITS